MENTNDLIDSINLDKVWCLNEHNMTGIGLYQEQDRRFEKDYSVISNCDEELLFIVPSWPRSKSGQSTSLPETSRPHFLRLYINN